MAAKPPRWVYWLAAAVWMIVSGPVGYAVGHNMAPAAATFEQPAPAAIPERAFPGARLNWVGSGTFRVPAQVPPGRYLITPSGSVLGCTWKRLKSTDGKPKSVIAAGAPNRGMSDEIVIAAGDRYLELLGDCTWAEL